MRSGSCCWPSSPPPSSPRRGSAPRLVQALDLTLDAVLALDHGSSRLPGCSAQPPGSPPQPHPQHERNGGSEREDQRREDKREDDQNRPDEDPGAAPQQAHRASKRNLS